jgi:hypothetical protein
MSIDVETVHLDKGAHATPGDGHCLMEVVAMFTGGPFTDRPACVSRVLREFGLMLNDQWDDDRRQDLRRFIPLLPDTAGDGFDDARAYLALDWLVRTFAPAWLDLAGLAGHAAELRAAAPVIDIGSAPAIMPLLTAAWDAARTAAGDAAGDAATDAATAAATAAARDAAGAAATAAAWDAARAAARDAAGAAATAAAWDAARAAARTAATDALQPTVDTLQASALDLFHRMIHPAVTP